MQNDRIVRRGVLALAACTLAVLLGCQSGSGKADPEAAEAYRIAQKALVGLFDGAKLDFPPQPERITKSEAGEYEVESHATDPNTPGPAGRLHWRVMVRRVKERWEIGAISARDPGKNTWEKVLDGWQEAP